MIKLTDTETDVKLAIPVAQKISVGIIMLSALATLFGIAAGLTYEIPIKAKPKPISPTPLIVSQISAAILDHTESDTVAMSFYRNNVLLAEGTLYSGVFYEVNIYQGLSKSPLSLRLENQEINPVSTDNHILNAEFLDMNSHSFSLTLCLPATSIPSAQTAVYYFDINGTPYRDVLLTQMATSKACHKLLANAYIPQDLISGQLSEAYPSSVPAHFQIYAVRDDHTMGWWENDLNTFFCGDESIISTPDENSRTPLALSLGQVGNPEQQVAFSLPARRLVLESDLGTNQLCLPAVNIEAGGHALFYYDQDGQPYRDVFLKTAVSCVISKSVNTNLLPVVE